MGMVSEGWTRVRVFLLVGVVIVAACSSGTPSSPPSSPPSSAPVSSATAPTATLSAGPTAVASSTAPSSVAPSTAWLPDPACTSTDPVVKQAIANTVARTGPQDTWHGPTSGPKPASGVKVVYIPTDAKNAISLSWGQNIIEASKKIGWDVTMIDGKGDAQGWTAAMTQAIALKPKAIIYTADAPTLKDLNKQANDAGIAVIGIHGTALPGPDAATNLFTNVTTDPRDIATAMAEYIIADSCGTAKAIIEYDSNYQIATMKGETMKKVFEACTTCTLLDYVNSPLSELETRQPQLCSNWANKYGKGWYAMTVYDGVWDFCVPALQAAGVGPTDIKLVASDGTQQGYQRIKDGKYQVATVPEPSELFAYAALDDAIRAAAGQPAVYGVASTGWQQPVFIHFKEPGRGDNLATEGGDKNQFFPTSDYVNRYLKLWGVSQ